MKRIINRDRSIYGIKKKLYTVAYDKITTNYLYYLNHLLSNNDADCLIYKANRKSKVVNKYTLLIMGVFYNFFILAIKLPFYIMIEPFDMYYEGGRNFIINSAWVDNVRFFNYVNIVLMIVFFIFSVYNLIF